MSYGAKIDQCKVSKYINLRSVRKISQQEGEGVKLNWIWNLVRIISFESNGFNDQQRTFLFKDCEVWGLQINTHFQLLMYQV